jgi:hypothetical protein
VEENWYAVEQQVRDRLSEARAAAQIRTLTQKLAPTVRRPNSVGITGIRLASWVLVRAMRLPLELLRALANVRPDGAAGRRRHDRRLREGPGNRARHRGEARCLR